MKLLVINGPNMNMLGVREPDVYGTESYASLCESVLSYCKTKGAAVDFFQSNSEGAIIDRIQLAYTDKTDGIIINPAAYSHYSYGIRDALSSVGIPTVEVHLTDIFSRETFRRVSVTADVCIDCITGKGFDGYNKAVDIFVDRLKNEIT